MSGRYDGPVVDPHHHLWDLSLRRHPWLMKSGDEEMVFGSLGAIQHDYLAEDYLRDAEGQNVVATVHVEAGWSDAHPLEETRWLDSLRKPGGIARRYVARVRLDSPEAARLVSTEADNPAVVGIRDIVSWHPDQAKSFAAPDRMDDPLWRGGLTAVANRGLVFDLMLFPWQMAQAARLAADFPNLAFVLNHCGSPADRSHDGMALWRAGLLELGRADNVSVKISDLVAYDNHWTLDSLRSVIEPCLECFGPKRAMFASDFPVAGLHASFAQVYDAFRAVAASLSADEQRALFFTNADAIYSLGMAAALRSKEKRHV